MNRFGPSTLVEAGEQKFLFDAGRGATQRLLELGVPWRKVQGVFLTHLHSDHVVGFPDLWLTGWLIAPGRTVPLQVWGPTGTTAMMSHISKAYEYDVGIRIQNEGASASGAEIDAHEIHEGVVYEDGGVRITAFQVDHPPVKPAFRIPDRLCGSVCRTVRRYTGLGKSYPALEGCRRTGTRGFRPGDSRAGRRPACSGEKNRLVSPDA